MSSSATKKPSFNKNNYLSKNEVLSWINNLLKVNLTLIEQLGSGTMYCQIMDVIYPGHIQLSKVKWGAKLEYDFIHNLKILQQCFDKLQIPQAIQVNKLAKTKYQDNLEFAQWLKAYFDFNCKDKGKGYDAVKRRGNAVPYFGFCKGGVLPKTTLFYRNPNEKFSIEGFSNDEIVPNNNEDQEQTTGQFNNFNQFQPEQPTSFNAPQQNTFFSRKEGSSSKGSALMNSFIQPPQGNTNFFAREEGSQSKNLTPSHIKMTQSENKASFFSNGISPMNLAQTEVKRSFQSQYFAEQVPRKLNFFKADDDEEKEVTQQLNQKNSSFNGLKQSVYQSKDASQGFFGSRQIFNPTQFTSNYQNNAVSDNKLNNNYFNSNLTSRDEQNAANNNSCNLNIDKQERKASSLATSVLLSKIQELTQASQTLLRRNSEEVKNSRSVNKLDIQEEESFQQFDSHTTPQSKKLNCLGEEHKSPFYETPISKKLKDNFAAAVIVQNENSTGTQQIQNDHKTHKQTELNIAQNDNQEPDKTAEIIENQQNHVILSQDSTSALNSQSENAAAKKKVDRISQLLSSSNSDDYSQIITQILKICQEN